jgi:hypothetical protein
VTRDFTSFTSPHHRSSVTRSTAKIDSSLTSTHARPASQPVDSLQTPFRLPSPHASRVCTARHQPLPSTQRPEERSVVGVGVALQRTCILVPLRAQLTAARTYSDPWTSEQDNNLQWQPRATSVRAGFGRCEWCFDGERVPREGFDFVTAVLCACPVGRADYGKSLSESHL